MSSYFQDFPQITYKFGNETSRALFQNISSYVDLIDNVKDNQSFFQKYFVQNERPDQVSYKFYGTTDYHWTLFLLNDHVRRSGWPLSDSHLLERAQIKYPNKTITTKSSLITGFNPGDSIVGLSSALNGTVIRKYPDLGQIVVSVTSGDAIIGEEILSNTNTLIVDSYEDEYLSAAHYVDANGNMADFDPSVGPGALLTEITYYDLMRQENDKLKEIKVIKPDSILSIVSAFQESLTTDP